MEIRIKMTEDEFKELEARAAAADFPTTHAFAHSLLFPKNDYGKKWAEVKAFIKQRTYDDGEFYIHDALPNTPAIFGRWAYEQRDALEIECVRKDRRRTNLWRKKQ